MILRIKEGDWDKTMKVNLKYLTIRFPRQDSSKAKSNSVYA